MSGNASPDVHGAGNTEITALATVGCIPSNFTVKDLRSFFYDAIEAGVFQAHSFGSKIATVLLHPLSSCTTAVLILDAIDVPVSTLYQCGECRRAQEGEPS